jgi:hypothetical protein
LHRVDRERFVKAIFNEWYALDRRLPQINAIGLYCRSISNVSLLKHLLQRIDACNASGVDELGSTSNDHSGSETNFHHMVVWLNLKKVANPGAARTHSCAP